MDSLALQTAIGMVLIFATFAAAVSALTELAARFIGLRGEYLLRGLRTLLDKPTDISGPQLELAPKDLFRRQHLPPQGPPPPSEEIPLTTKVITSPIVAVSADKARMPPDAGNAKLTRAERQQLPSYLSARSFVTAITHVLVPDAKGRTTIEELRAAISTMDDGPLKQALTAISQSVGQNVTEFRAALERWYDDHMARVSGWYKRHVRWISLGVGAVLVLTFNLNAVSIAQALYTDQALRASVVVAATDAAECTSPPAECLQEVREQIDSLRGAGIPIGWGPVPQCIPHAKCGWMARYGLADPERTGRFDVFAFLLVLTGWAIMILALVPGARFWFDSLSRLGSLRSTGPKPSMQK